MAKNVTTLNVIAICIILLFSIFLGVFANLGENFFDSLPTIFTKPLKVKASIPYWEQKEASKSFQENIHSFDYIQVFWYFISEEGSIKTYKYATEDQQLIKQAHENNVKVLAIITNLPEEENTTWDSSLVENVLKDEISVQKHIEDIQQKINSLNLDGVIIDYESVDASQKDKFSNFIKSLSQAMHSQNKVVAVSVHPKTHDNDGLGKFQDWKKISENADHISIMSYGEHWDESEPGPIASITWLERIIKYTKELRIPGRKIYLGVPLYGLKWEIDSKDDAQGLTFKDVEQLIQQYDIKPQWDNNTSSEYLKYQVDETDFEVWFESQDTIERKLTLAQKAGFAGVSFWRLGGEDYRVWEVVKKFRQP